MEKQNTASAFHHSPPITDFRPPRPASPSASNSAGPETSSSLLQQSSSIDSTASTSTLRFPMPEGSQTLAHWVNSSSARKTDTMQPSNITDEASSLADSTYELISSTDGESQDGRGTESLGDSLADSVDLCPRPDDVRSLTGRDVADEDEDEVEDEDGDEQEEAGDGRGLFSTPSQGPFYEYSIGEHLDCPVPKEDSIRYAEAILGSPSTHSRHSTPDFELSQADITVEPAPLFQSIEFNENDEADVSFDKISVKHVVRDFDERETLAMVTNLRTAGSPPKRLSALVRQTMAHSYLSTREPLRVLYVGSDAAYNDIMYKISSALLASAPSGPPTHSGSGRRHSSNSSIYNIMPISNFGSTKVPEIDEIQLMGVSDYYIKVERCTKATEMKLGNKSSPNDSVYSIILDGERTHLSISSPQRPTVRPHWALPHVAVFYVASNDDDDTETTRNAAWEFMTRHAVPSIFISHSQTFSRCPSAGRWPNFVDQAAVHLSLESRDPERPMTPDRLPIDLISFLNIDARQLNRNLAYLTGLQDTSVSVEKNGNATVRTPNATGGVSTKLANSLHRLYHKDDAHQAWPLDDYSKLMKGIGLRAITATALGLLLWSCAMVSIRILHLSSSSLFDFTSSTSGLVPSGVTATFVPRFSITATGTTPPACSVPPLTPTVTISLTSTKTVEVRVSESSTSTTQVHFGGLLTDRAHQHTKAEKATSEIKSIGCSIQVYSNHEILVKVPFGTKTTWLAKGAIDIDVWRGQKILKSKLSTTDEGIIIEINKKDAYGVMNVSIVTTRRPKINETFAVDFGKPTVTRLLEEGAGACRDSLQMALDSSWEAAGAASKAVFAYTSNLNRATVAESAQGALDQAMWFLSKAKTELENQAASTAGSYAQVHNTVKRTGQFLADKTKRLHVGSAIEKAAHDAHAFVRSSVDKAAREVFHQAADAVQQMPPVDEIRENVELSVLRAQVASHLWWLRVQGKMEEHDYYEAKSTQFICERERAAARQMAKAGKGAITNLKLCGQKVTRRTAAQPAKWFW